MQCKLDRGCADSESLWCFAAGCGVVPVKHAHLADWVGGNSSYDADGRFYHELSECLPRTYLIPHVIYIYGHPYWAG